MAAPVTSSVDLRDRADYVVIGEAEDVMSQLIADLESGCAAGVYRAGELPRLDKTPRPDLSLIKPRLLQHHGSAVFARVSLQV